MTETKSKLRQQPAQQARRASNNTYQFPIWLRALTTAEVGERPSRIPLHAELVILAQKRQKRPQGTLLENVISANWAVTGDISQSPNGLLADIENGGGEQPDELRDGVGVDDHLGVVSGSGSNIR